eukprot:2582298-Rhodomonas_salina.1
MEGSDRESRRPWILDGWGSEETLVLRIGMDGGKGFGACKDKPFNVKQRRRARTLVQRRVLA